MSKELRLDDGFTLQRFESVGNHLKMSIRSGSIVLWIVWSRYNILAQADDFE